MEENRFCILCFGCGLITGIVIHAAVIQARREVAYESTERQIERETMRSILDKFAERQAAEGK